MSKEQKENSPVQGAAITVKDFLLKKFPTDLYFDCPVPTGHWEVMQEYAEAYHLSVIQPVQGEGKGYSRDEIELEFRSIISHALLGSDTEDVSKETWDLVFSECAKYMASLTSPPEEVEPNGYTLAQMKDCWDASEKKRAELQWEKETGIKSKSPDRETYLTSLQKPESVEVKEVQVSDEEIEKRIDECLKRHGAGGYVNNKRYRQLSGHREQLYKAILDFAKEYKSISLPVDTITNEKKISYVIRLHKS